MLHTQKIHTEQNRIKTERADTYIHAQYTCIHIHIYTHEVNSVEFRSGEHKQQQQDSDDDDDDDDDVADIFT